MRRKILLYLMGPYNAGPKSALIKAAVRGAGVISAILEKFLKRYLFSNFGILHPFFLTNFLTNIPMKSGNKDLFIFRTI